MTLFGANLGFRKSQTKLHQINSAKKTEQFLFSFKSICAFLAFG